MHATLPYGQAHLTIDLPDTCVDVLEMRRTAIDPVRLALAAPIGSPQLRALVSPGQKIVIVTSDVTRPCPAAQLLPALLEELHAGGIDRSDVTVVFGLGTHRAQTPAEHARLLGDLCGQLTCLDSTAATMIPVGVTARGTPIEVCEAVVRADVRIALGSVEYHYFAGYSGGAKALIPGVCSATTIRHNHAMMVDPRARAGCLEDNPVREDIEEGVALISLDFILNVVMEEGQIVLAAAGHPVHAHRWACRAVDHLSAVQIEQAADIVVVSAGGYPKDINLYQAQKALDNAATAVRTGGVIVWVAECREGLGNTTFEQWMVGASADAILQQAPTFWPDPKTAILPHLAVANLNYNITQIIISSHLGTHADAPFHFFDDGLTIEQIDVLRGFGPAEVLDLRYKAPQSTITVEDLQAFGDRIRPGCRLIFWTDWDKQFPQPHYFGDQPRLHVETCEWMVQQGVRWIAMDLPTTNPPEYTPTHYALLNAQAQVLIVEGLRGIERLQSQQVILMALPLRLRGRAAAPGPPRLAAQSGRAGRHTYLRGQTAHCIA